MNKHDSKREGMETERCPSSVGSNPTPRTNNIKFAGSSSSEGFILVFWYFGFLNILAPLCSHTYSKPASTNAHISV